MSGEIGMRKRIREYLRGYAIAWVTETAYVAIPCL